MVKARLAAAPLGYGEVTDRRQAAFSAAGGIDAWYGMLNGNLGGDEGARTAAAQVRGDPDVLMPCRSGGHDAGVD